MDDRRFDSLIRQLGAGASRRSVLKGLLGLGGALAPASTLAARRPTPTPKPVKCPGTQHWNGTACVCDAGTNCGSDCCTGESVCCDNACCYGQCFGEELCCPTGQIVCNGECLPVGVQCNGDNCCADEAVCVEGQCMSACRDDGDECSASTECCSGICSAGYCRATRAGTCSGEANYCDGGGAEFCNGVPSCYCMIDGAGSTLCADSFECVESCRDCPTEAYCASYCPVCSGKPACIYLCPPDGGSCFTGETQVAMADGTSRPVSEVRIGDRVLGDDGAINTVVAIDLPLLGNRLLYGFDGDSPFVTGSHPFQTDDGWKAIEPAESYRDHRLPGVRQLTVQDRLVRLSGVLVAAGGAHGERVLVQSEPHPIAQIAPVSADPATQLYNLRLDGNHTYFANGLLVHNK